MAITVITGPMFCGKTERLVDRLARFVIAKRPVFIFVSAVDNRGKRSVNDVVVKKNVELASKKLPLLPLPLVIRGPEEILSLWGDIAAKSRAVVAISEAQFFPKDSEKSFLDLFARARKNKVSVYIEGLDTNFRHEPFGLMGNFLALATKVIKLKAVCEVCGRKASYTERLIDGKPALATSAEIIVGDKDKSGDGTRGREFAVSYEPRCGECFELA